MSSKEKGKSNAFYLAPVSLFEKSGIKPIVLTILGAVITATSAYFFAQGDFLIAGIIMAVGSIFDLFDGELARRTDQVTNFGGFIDSNLDRVSEFAIYLGLFIYYQHAMMRLVIFATLFFTQMVSYARARAEGADMVCSKGFFSRGVRIILLFIGSILGIYYMKYILIVILIGAAITFVQRIVVVKKQDK